MSQTSILLPQTVYTNPGDGSGYEVVGEKQKGNSYYLGCDDLHTFSLHVTDFTGTILLEATLNNGIGNTDWFVIQEIIADYNAENNTILKNNSNLNSFFNIAGNFVYVRARLVNFKHGLVKYIKVSF